MQLTLTAEETRTLRDILLNYLPQLRRETARTELAARGLRHELTLRENLCERLLAELDGAATGPAGTPA